MPLTKATTNVVNLDKDTLINGLTVGKGASNGPANTAVGYNALSSNISGAANTSVGHESLLVNTIGSNNSAFGNSSLKANTTGEFNTGCGAGALEQNTSGNNNTAVGLRALYSNTTGFANTAVGVSALQNNTGFANSAIGYASLQDNTIGNFNTAIGNDALQFNITGDYNTATGFRSLYSNTTFSNVGGFGYNAQVSGSNQIRIGDTNITSVTCQTNAWSDARDKADIRDTVLGLDFIKELRPVDYKWDYREDYRPEAPAHVGKPIEPKEDASDEDKAKYAQELAEYNAYVVLKDKWLEDCKWSNLVHDGTHKRTRFHHGLIAQEVKSVIEKTGVDFGGFQDHTIKGGDAVMTIGYTELIGPLIKAIQELSAKVAELEAK
jgi:hypothetical protein